MTIQLVAVQTLIMTNIKHLTRLNSLFEMAKEVERSGNARVVAALYVKNELISIGWNQSRTSPFAARYQKNSEALSLHAEIHAIKQALRLFKVDELIKAKTTLYIIRAKLDRSSGQFVWGLSKPCVGCFRGIVDFGIKRIVYSMDETVEHGRTFEELP